MNLLEVIVMFINYFSETTEGKMTDTFDNKVIKIIKREEKYVESVLQIVSEFKEENEALEYLENLIS